MRVWKINDTVTGASLYKILPDWKQAVYRLKRSRLLFSPLSEQMQSCDAKAYQQSLVCSIEVAVN